MLRELQALLKPEKKMATGPDQSRRIKELEAIVAAKNAEIAELRKRLISNPFRWCILKAWPKE